MVHESNRVQTTVFITAIKNSNTNSYSSSSYTKSWLAYQPVGSLGVPSGPLAAVAAAAQAGPAFCSSSSRHGTPVAGGGTLSDKSPGGQYLEKQSAGDTCTCRLQYYTMSWVHALFTSLAI